MIRYTAPRTSVEKRRGVYAALALAAVALTGAACSSSSSNNETIPVATATGSDLIELDAGTTAKAIETMHDDGVAANVEVC
jgi:hypothetical protein